MKFSPASTTENYPLLRLLSESGVWELGLVPMLFGVRVRFGLSADRIGYTSDYCAGADRNQIFLLLSVMTAILEDQPETISETQLRAMLPTYEIRPIFNDPTCFPALLELAHHAMQKQQSGAA